MTAITEQPISDARSIPSVIELEITEKCQLRCTHCYADSGPDRGHGSMDLDDWRRVISESAELGIRQVQLIGGEVMTRPGWDKLVDHALNVGLTVEVFSNLYHVTDKAWRVLSRPGVTLATSYYSVNAGEHDKVTKVAGSHERTRDNICAALRRGVPIRAGIVGVHDGQLEVLARAELEALGVQRITLDYARGVGRAATAEPNVSTLCGNCGRGRLAIMPTGDVAPCVLGRFLRPGNVKDPGGLRAVLASPEWLAAVTSIPGTAERGCPPSDSNDCSPANTEACGPKY